MMFDLGGFNRRFGIRECIRGMANPKLTTQLNLMGLISASSFDVRASSVNALTEELRHIRFPAHTRKT
jgi:hypothetical protein